jgi:molybdenum cofactor cytidylyltransferase
MPISIVILAAGSSSRMGQSKQLMRIGDEAMLRLAIKKAQASKADNCVVVLGSNEDAHLDAIIDLNALVVVNPHWERGMGSSLKAGLKFLITHEKPDAILVMLSDQPAVTTVHLNNIIDAYHSSLKRIVAAEYGDSPGVPALIDSSLFRDLIDLEDSSGAKSVLMKHKNNLQLIPMPEAAIDIDTPDDYRRYHASH